MKTDQFKTEDERLKMLKMIKFIYKNVLDDVLYTAVNESLFNPCLGHFISTLITMAISDKYFEIKNRVIKIIDLIINRLNDYYKLKKRGHNPADLMASFLPGISQFLMKMITKDAKQNKIVYINSLKALASLFCFVYRNYEDGLTERMDSNQFLMPRTKEWRFKSIEKLNIMIELIDRALNNQSIQVKESLINFTTIITFHIVDHQENHDLLPLISRNLFKITLALLYDDNQTVNELAYSFTQKVIDKFENSNQFALQEHLMDDLIKAIDDFEKEISVYNEDSILKNLKLLCGYLNCFEQNAFNLILFNQKDKLFNLLKLIFKLDFNRMSGNCLPKEQTEFTNIDWFEKKFYYFENKKMLNQLDVLCNLIKKLSDQNVLNDYVMDSLVQIKENYKNELMNNQITNDETNSLKDRSTNLLVISYLVKTFESNELNLQIINRLVDLVESRLNEIDNVELFIDERFELTVLCAVLMELITNYAYSISGDEQRLYFKSTLYTILACTGSTHLQIQVNAKASIVKLAKIFNYSSVQDLILSNLDFLISKMHIKMNNYNDKDNLYYVFKIIFEFTDAETCHHFDQTISNLLIAMDINYSIVNFERLAKILLLIVRTFRKWFVKKEENLKKRSINNRESKLNEFKSDLIEFIRQKEEDKKNLQEFEEELKNEKIDEQTILDEQKKIEGEQLEEDEKNLPIHIECTKRVIYSRVLLFTNLKFNLFFNLHF